MEQLEEQTLAIIKPEAFREGHVEFIMNVISGLGLRVETEKDFNPMDRSIAALHYHEHIGKFFHDKIVTKLSTGQSRVMILAGPDAIRVWRQAMGEYDEATRVPGTIRGDLMQPGQDLADNYVHGSADEPAAKKEIAALAPLCK